MNKFVLSVLVILAIGMAELPSIFGCNRLPIIAAPRSGSAATSWFIQHHLNGAIGADTRSVDAGGNVFELELEGFSICNTDGTEGLTFDEINACRIRLGEFVVYSWPTASDFDAADDNGDGSLTIAEFVQYLG